MSNAETMHVVETLEGAMAAYKARVALKLTGPDPTGLRASIVDALEEAYSEGLLRGYDIGMNDAERVTARVFESHREADDGNESD